VKSNLLDGGHRTVRDRPVPYTVYLDPQLGRVGLTEKQAKEAGIEIRIAKMPLKSVARALETSETRGVMKVIVDARNEEIVGAAILGSEGGEIMSILEVAMMGKLKYSALRDAVFAHPTLAESLNNLFFRFTDERR
jgi:pyruvate/2-oxoglutarate dehydrogenase complex dihydrolipoamide dehydrogenase (E3) component